MIKHEPNSNCLIIPLSDIMSGDATAWGYNSDDIYTRSTVNFDMQLGGLYIHQLKQQIYPSPSEIKDKVIPLLQELKDTTNNYQIYEQVKSILNWLE